MELADIWKAQRQALSEQLSTARNCVRSQNLPQALRARMEVRLNEDLIGKQQRALDRLVEKRATPPTAKDWDDLRKIQGDCDVLFRESLALLSGCLARGAGFDNSLCDIADAMLGELCRRAGVRWDRFTIPGGGEEFSRTSDVIRLRFPDVSLWNLPVAVHEFGHFLAKEQEEKVNDGSFVDDLRVRLAVAKSKGQDQWRFVHEYFADVFATCAMGPAYACSVILLRFNAAQAWSRGAEHPADGERVELILRMLKHLNEQTPAKPYSWIHQELSGAWQQALTLANQPLTGDDKVMAALDAVWGTLEVLFSNDLKKVEYPGWSLSRRLGAAMGAGNQPPSDAGRAGIADILNAAWMARLELDANSVVDEADLEKAARGLLARQMAGD